MGLRSGLWITTINPGQISSGRGLFMYLLGLALSAIFPVCWLDVVWQSIIVAPQDSHTLNMAGLREHVADLHGL